MGVTHPGSSEVARFLALRPPFDVLTPAELGELISATELEFHPAGTVILSVDGGPVTLLRVIHSGAVDLTHDGQLLDLLGPGDTFGHAPMLSGLPSGFQASASQDTLCYRIPVAAARPLLDRARTRELAVGATDSGSQPVARLIRVPAVMCEPAETIREVARRMTDAGASCAIVMASGGLGIVTDRDIRSKIVAGGEPLSTPVATVMSTPVYSVTPDRLGSEVLFEMLERGISHAPVVSGPGQVVGVVEDADLFAVGPRSWFGVRRQLDRAETLEDLARAAGRLPALVFDRGSSQLRATDLIRVFSALIDAVTIRALDLAANAGTPAGAGVVWVAVGSHARRELTPASPLRGAIVCARAPEDAFTEAAGEALRRIGFTGEVIARGAEQWRQSAATEELALMLLVERRAIWGAPQEPLPFASEAAQAALVRRLAQLAAECRPPTGFDERYVLEADGRRSERLDIRRAAVLPIMALGRWAGAIAGVLEGSTAERLTAAAATGALSQDDACTLIDAFSLALELRVSHHIEQLSAGTPADDRIDPRPLSPLMRDELRDVFRAIAAVQRNLRQ
ncbi:MAG: putative nucleotidyltransferase substrate binding domain-containing protein [Solirubrobacteraceae bacterium]